MGNALKAVAKLAWAVGVCLIGNLAFGQVQYGLTQTTASQNNSGKQVVDDWVSSQLDRDLATASNFDEDIVIDSDLGISSEVASNNDLLSILIRDQQNFYSRETLVPLFAVLGGHAILSNTRMDQELADWYQDDVRSSGTDDASEIFKTFGEHFQALGIFAATSVVTRVVDVDPRVQVWSDRCLRSFVVGAGPVYLLQRSIGASRPGDTPPTSNWDFWADDNGVSGHAFVGAVPFLVAAQLNDRPVPKALLLFGSTLTGWSRINDNAHYTSQVIMGWSIAYAATNAIRLTDRQLGIEIAPIMIGKQPGVGFSLRY